MFNKVENFTYEYSGVVYPVVITRKRMKNIQYRIKDNVFLISAPRLASRAYIFKGLEKFAPKLIKKSIKHNPYCSDGVYIFGEKYPFNIINIDNREIDLSFSDNLKETLSSLLLDYIKEKVEYYSQIMGIIDAYKVKVRDTKTRLGSNSRKTKTLAFAYSLVHFSKEIIDSVVVHELAHCKVFNHSKEFYDVVYLYCPNYNILRKKLIHSEFK